MALMTNKRSTYWASICYPESMKKDPKGILEHFNQRSIGFYLSPLHNKDKDEDGKPKKEHYHLLIRFASLKSQMQVQEILGDITDVAPVIISNITQYGRYLLHLDNPEKAQYNQSDVVTNLDYNDFLAKEKKQFGIKQMFTTLLNGGSISQLVKQALEADDYDGIELIRQNIQLLKAIGQESFANMIYAKEKQVIKQQAKTKMEQIDPDKYIETIRKNQNKKTKKQ
jgi:hypothetical protein